jgi:excisionase family DNA binding protein
MSNDHPLTLTVVQAGQVLGVGRSTAYELVRSGDLRCIRLRRRIVVPVAHLAECLGVDRAAIWATLADSTAELPRPPAAEPSGTRRARRGPSTTTETPTLF